MSNETQSSAKDFFHRGISNNSSKVSGVAQQHDTAIYYVRNISITRAIRHDTDEPVICLSLTLDHNKTFKFHIPLFSARIAGTIMYQIATRIMKGVQPTK
jgi:hypothetical protein